MASRTFVHTIGGYYRDRERFIKEARTSGANRRIAVHLLPKFNFGDVVMVLDWDAPVKGKAVRTVGQKGRTVPTKAVAYGQFVVERLSFQSEVMARLAKKVLDDGDGEWREGGEVVARECGSYVDGGGVVLNPESELTLPDLLARAKLIAAEMGIKKLETFIGGRFQAFSDPIQVERPPFQMGFWEVVERPVRRRAGGGREVSGIGSYHLRTRAVRADPLLLPAPAPDEVTTV